MRLLLLSTLLAVACSHPTPNAPTTIANKDMNTSTPEPVADTQPKPTPAECLTWDGRTGSEFADQLYCRATHDGCCGTGGQVWVCNNANYVDWYFQHCPQ